MNNFLRLVILKLVVGPTILHKIFETNKRIREMYHIFHEKFNC